MARTLSRDWVGYSKSEFLQKMPGTWYGATAEDRGQYVVVRNLELYGYFEFHFMFGGPQDLVELLVIRGLNELQDLSIVGQSGEAVCRLKPAKGSSISRDAKKAANILQKRFGIGQVEG